MNIYIFSLWCNRKSFLVNLPNILFQKRINNVYSSRKKMILKLLHSILALLTEASVTEATYYRKFIGKKINKIDSLNEKERKFMGAKKSLAQKHEMYPRPTFFSTGWKGQKIIQWCYKTITSFCFLKCTIKPEPHSLVQTVNYDNISIVLIHL